MKILKETSGQCWTAFYT